MLTPERERWQKQINVFDVIEAPVLQTSTSGRVQPPYADSNIIPQYPANTVRHNFSGTPLEAMPSVMEKFGDPTRLVVCGPEVMMRATAHYFAARHLPATAIWLSVERRMHCAVGLCGHCYLCHRYVCTDGPTFCWDEIGDWL